LSEYRIDGRKVLNLEREEDQAALPRVLGRIDIRSPADAAVYGMESRDSILSRTTDIPVITADNMGTEWRFGTHQL
jgi:hypothetical protein